MLCFGLLLLDFSIARGTNAEYSAGRDMKGSGGAAAPAWDDDCLGRIHGTPTDLSALVRIRVRTT